MSASRILRRHLLGCALVLGGMTTALVVCLWFETFNGVSVLSVLAIIAGAHLILDSIDRSSRLALRRDDTTEGTTP